MPVPIKYRASFEEKRFYHVFNKTNNKEKLFLTNENYSFFRQKLYRYLSPFAELYSCSLLTDQFHLIISIKPEQAICSWLSLMNQEKLTKTEKNYCQKDISIDKLIQDAFKRFFQSYAMSFNKTYSRKGNLFHKSFKRVVLRNLEEVKKQR